MWHVQWGAQNRCYAELTKSTGRSAEATLTHFRTLVFLMGLTSGNCTGLSSHRKALCNFLLFHFISDTWSKAASCKLGKFAVSSSLPPPLRCCHIRVLCDFCLIAPVATVSCHSFPLSRP